MARKGGYMDRENFEVTDEQAFELGKYQKKGVKN